MISVQGVAKFDLGGKLSAFETVEHVTLTDSLDIDRRVAELSLLKDGWHDGEGSAPNPDRLRLAGTQLRTRLDPTLPPPFLYPTLGGDLRAEWSLEAAEVSLDIILADLAGNYSALDIASGESVEQTLDLSKDESWTTLNQHTAPARAGGHRGLSRMTDSTMLLRQIHPAFVQADQATSQAFRPTPKDDGKLSVYDGDKIRSRESMVTLHQHPGTGFRRRHGLACGGVYKGEKSLQQPIPLPSRNTASSTLRNLPQTRKLKTQPSCSREQRTRAAGFIASGLSTF